MYTKSKITSFRFHDIKHTFAAMLIEQGVDIVVVKELLGHADIKNNNDLCTFRFRP